VRLGALSSELLSSPAFVAPLLAVSGLQDPTFPAPFGQRSIAWVVRADCWEDAARPEEEGRGLLSDSVVLAARNLGAFV